VNDEYLIGGVIDPSYYSQTGAFNGSGIALASQSFARDLSQGTQGAIVLYFQHHTGEIRWIQLSSTGEWHGGSSSEVVAVNAKNSTPLSAVAYSSQGVDTWHIFCVIVVKAIVFRHFADGAQMLTQITFSGSGQTATPRITGLMAQLTT
jgi:hypothetical protein